MNEPRVSTLPHPIWDPLDGEPERSPVIRTTAMPADANPAGDIFGGWLLSQMDLAAASLATRRARGRTATAALEAMSFLSPVLVGDEVSLFARLISEGRSSMRIAVEAWRRHRENEIYEKVTEGLFVLVAIDENRKARPLPPLEPKL